MKKDGIEINNVVTVDGKPGWCGLCQRDVPKVANIQVSEKHEDGHTNVTTRFVCRACATGDVLRLFDMPDHEIYNGVVQPDYEAIDMRRIRSAPLSLAC